MTAASGAILYTGCGLDRVSARRANEAWIEAQRQAPTIRVLPYWRGRNLVIDGEPPRLAAATGASAQDVAAAAETLVFLGTSADGCPWFAADLSAGERRNLPTFGDGTAFRDLWRVGARLARDDGAILAYARGMLHWHRQHRFCGLCGQPTRVREGGHMRVCTNEACAEKHFPRTDPVVIMLVTHGDGARARCVLARQPAWPAGLHSALAGFVEPGESLEEAVVREVREEVGLDVTRLSYFTSQPWPFPGSLMLGYCAAVDDASALRFDAAELEDARWFSRADVLAFARPERYLPYRGTIARALIEAWLAEGGTGGRDGADGC
jgi:NAD+ diphosphatase